MRVSNGRVDGAPSQKRTDTFSGNVWADPVLPSEDGVTVNAVLFEPGGRTYWHTHEVAQILHVIQGEGRLQHADGSGMPLRPGDVAHIPAGELHWHGATPDTMMLHVAVSVGATSWADEVADGDYTTAFEAQANFPSG